MPKSSLASTYISVTCLSSNTNNFLKAHAIMISELARNSHRIINQRRSAQMYFDLLVGTPQSHTPGVNPNLKRSRRSVAAVLCATLLSACGMDQAEEKRSAPVISSSELLNSNIENTKVTPDQLLWGDLHIHSNISFDAFSFGNRRLTSAD